MPRIELIPEVLYTGNDPIHWEIDNLPLKNIIRRQNLINLALDDVIEQIRDAIGTQGSMANRLNQSIAADGSLKATAIDEAMHSIEEHEDTDDYVRMTSDERDKLANMADGATSLTVEVYTSEDTSETFDAGSLEIHPSDSVTPILEAPNKLSFELAFPVAAAHQHYYGLEPVDLEDPNENQYYQVANGVTEFVEGSLRVYVNGVRIFSDIEIYVPGALVDDPWTLLSFTPNHEEGTFELSAAIADEDIIRIDFDTAFL